MINLNDMPELWELQLHDFPYLERIVKENGFKRVLEIGTFRGLTTVRLAPLVDSVDTIEVDVERAEEAKSLASKLNLANICFHVGDSLEVLASLTGCWDCVVLDGAHTYAYTMAEYFAVLPCLAENAIVIFDDASYVDNTCLNGGVPRTVKVLDCKLYHNLAFKLFGEVTLPL